ncbi:hypothetical protein NW066_06430 [Mycoplasmopsis felis]|uniref:hypothetical protein n=1 Tax=Mycoplasmopsis felis TaxID=33923 RepID=UPI0021AEBB44|nr:hypothetical protein [Mycoplasmopsis felis]UWV85107.1 hypothetical protein NW066_06430 [Mycoplasmopsis felis]
MDPDTWIVNGVNDFNSLLVLYWIPEILYVLFSKTLNDTVITFFSASFLNVLDSIFNALLSTTTLVIESNSSNASLPVNSNETNLYLGSLCSSVELGLLQLKH